MLLSAIDAHTGEGLEQQLTMLDAHRAFTQDRSWTDIRVALAESVKEGGKPMEWKESDELTIQLPKSTARGLRDLIKSILNNATTAGRLGIYLAEIYRSLDEDLE